MPDAKGRPRWSSAALRDLEEIWRYHDESASRAVADRLLRGLIDAAEDAAKRPLIRRRRDDIWPGLRAVLAHPYAVFYRAGLDGVEIVRVLHEKRDFMAVFQGGEAED